MSFRPTKKNSPQNSLDSSKQKEEWSEENCLLAIEEGNKSKKETAYLKLAMIKHQQRMYQEAIEFYNKLEKKT
jgi:hypothetical protein